MLVGTIEEGPQLIASWRWSDALFARSDIDRLTQYWQRGVTALAAAVADEPQRDGSKPANGLGQRHRAGACRADALEATIRRAAARSCADAAAGESR